jgi:hypothetical protein
MANLLLHLESFMWHDLELSHATEMDNLILAVDKTDELDDTIWGHPDAYNLLFDWGILNDLLTLNNEEITFFTKGWFTNDHQKILLKLWRNPTLGQSRNLIEMEREDGFQNANNGLIGCYYKPLPNKMVFCDNSLIALHSTFVNSNYNLRSINPEYFYKYYIPQLQIKPNTINDLISKKQVNNCFIRLDMPKMGANNMPLHGEKIQMHFSDSKKSCLNIDGTWKHAGFKIPEDAKIQLIEWGFIVL